MPVFYRLAPVCSLAGVLRRDCQIGADFGVVVERPVLLDSLALCLVVDGSLTRQADVDIRPYKGDGDSASERTHRSAPNIVL